MESSSLLAEWYFENSQPVTAACCHLAVNDVQVGASRTSIYIVLKSNRSRHLIHSHRNYIVTLEGQRNLFSVKTGTRFWEGGKFKSWIPGLLVRFMPPQQSR